MSRFTWVVSIAGMVHVDGFALATANPSLKGIYKIIAELAFVLACTRLINLFGSWQMAPTTRWSLIFDAFPSTLTYSRFSRIFPSSLHGAEAISGFMVVDTRRP